MVAKEVGVAAALGPRSPGGPSGAGPRAQGGAFPGRGLRFPAPCGFSPPRAQGWPAESLPECLQLGPHSALLLAGALGQSVPSIPFPLYHSETPETRPSVPPTRSTKDIDGSDEKVKSP